MLCRLMLDKNLLGELMCQVTRLQGCMVVDCRICLRDEATHNVQSAVIVPLEEQGDLPRADPGAQESDAQFIDGKSKILNLVSTKLSLRHAFHSRWCMTVCWMRTTSNSSAR